MAGSSAWRGAGAGDLAPLRAVAWALLVVLVDLRLGGPDVLPDPLGWLVAAALLGRLGGRHPGFAVAAGAAAVACVVSLVELVEPGQAWSGLVDGVASTAVLFATCTAVRALVPAEAESADRLRWAYLALAVVLGLLVALARLDAAVGLLALAVGVGVLVVFVLFLLLLLRVGRASADAAI